MPKPLSDMQKHLLTAICPPIVQRPRSRWRSQNEPAPLCDHISSLGPLLGSQKVGCSPMPLACSHRLLWGERTISPSARLPLPPIRDEPRLKMQICCRMQSAASQPTRRGGGAREGGNKWALRRASTPIHSLLLITWPLVHIPSPLAARSPPPPY